MCRVSAFAGTFLLVHKRACAKICTCSFDWMMLEMLLEIFVDVVGGDKLVCDAGGSFGHGEVVVLDLLIFFQTVKYFHLLGMLLFRLSN